MSIVRRALAPVAALALGGALPCRAAAQSPLPLVPAPREATAGAPFAAPGGVAVDAPADAGDRGTATDLSDVLRERGQLAAARGGAVARVRLLRRESAAGRAALARAGLAFDAAMTPEGYVLVADGGRVDVVGATSAGVLYGAQTVKQLVEGRGTATRVLGARVRDWPAMRWRGFHDDISRGPVPTLEFQKKQIRTFAAYKMNVYSPYFEHTLAYASDPLFAAPGGAVTRAQARELVEYARRYHVEIVPEQEAFGHLHHVLTWEKYTPIGETERGSVLAPEDPRTIPLVTRLFTELDSLFPGRFLHIGADETFDLGRGRTADEVRAQGYGAVYASFVARIASALKPLNRRLVVWGDIASDHPELVPMLPKDMIAVPWNYDLPLASYDKLLQPFRAAGLETWVAPGVSSWNRVYPNNDVALQNIRAFVREGQKAGATGVLNTSWDDFGEGLFNQQWLGVIFGAAASWQAGDSDPAPALAAYARDFHGDTTGHVAEAERRLIAAHALLRTAGLGDASDRLFWVDPLSPEGQLVAARLLPVARDLRLAAEDAIEHVIAARRAGATREPDALDAIELGARRVDAIGLKFQLADDVQRIYARVYAMNRDTARARDLRWYDLADVTGINGRLQDLRDLFSQTRDLYEAAWLRENRPYWLRNVLARYDEATQLWVRRIDRLNDVRSRWARDHTMPPGDSLGIPAPVTRVPPKAP
ncbi:Glycoside hydrolase, family 20, catalytic core [Gemmatirosa kalamazoonensis]|uniref:beta-N-acetylhexosaminidase n=1 Tax=Gemmatirosa kalamazoonensis TaxID=861299 RepID=W0RIF2_9BACT|nr:family 20 glycosylhydrolase [Gemmatirosa kalamazoonensis]AHG90566.1 Glycoside hydrolase, family 20, catalytic core [Gemmatirosa kalamazoonensis]